MGTVKADSQTTLSSDVNRNYKQFKVAVSSTEANIPTQIPIQHNNSGKVKTVSIEGDPIRCPCLVLNTTPDNGSLINTHISSNNIMNHGSNMIINTEVNSSSPQHYRAGITLDQRRLYHRPGIYLHWIQRHGKRGATSYKWAASTVIDQLRPGPSSSSSHSVQGHEEVLDPSSLWQSWARLEGGGPINKPVTGSAMRTRSNDSNQAATLRVTATADMSISVIPVRVQPTDNPTAQARSEESSSVPLSSVASLRGPQARSNRATVLAGITCAPSVNVPTGI